LKTKRPLPSKNRLGLQGANAGSCCFAADVSGEILSAKPIGYRKHQNVLSGRVKLDIQSALIDPLLSPFGGQSTRSEVDIQIRFLYGGMGRN